MRKDWKEGEIEVVLSVWEEGYVHVYIQTSQYDDDDE